jgi:anti-anti-sigma factor
MKLKSSEKGKYTIIEIEGRIDTSNYESFSQEIQSYIDKGVKFIVMEMSKLEYISSSGLRVFLSSLKTLRAIEGDVALCCLNDKIKNVFEVSGFLDLFGSFDNYDAIED